jgi:glycosyltransferase involved in cell wall biosynthesis
MRVLITTDAVGGVWSFTQDLAAALLERGCAVLLISFGRMPSAAQEKECAELSAHFGAHFRYVPSSVPLEWMEENQSAFAAGAEIIRAEAELFAPDIIHSNQFCFGAVDIPAPRIITAHSDVLSWARPCRKEPLQETPWLHRYTAMVQKGLCGADAVVAPTKWMLHALSESFTLPPERAVVHNGSSVVAPFGSSRLLCAVTAGRLWDEAKGIHLLEQIDSPMPILVAGDSRLDSAARPHLATQCRMLGVLSRNQMTALLSRSSVYLCLSVYEPFGLAALEAGRCGCAVLARDITSLREVWEDGALYFDGADQLSDLLRRLNQDPRLLLEARRQSFGRAKSFSSSQMVERYLQVYETVQMRSARIEHVA